MRLSTMKKLSEQPCRDGFRMLRGTGSTPDGFDVPLRGGKPTGSGIKFTSNVIQL
jgi:hypothetical protein